MEHLFRIWDMEVSPNKMVYLESNLPYKITLGGSVVYNDVYVNKCELMRAIGMQDKNKNTIFEGDILKTSVIDGGKHILVQSPQWFICDAFTVFGYHNLYSFSNEDRSKEISQLVQQSEIVGNKWENPELLDLL